MTARAMAIEENVFFALKWYPIVPSRWSRGGVAAHSRRNEGSKIDQRRRFGGHLMAQLSIKKRMVAIGGGG